MSNASNYKTVMEAIATDQPIEQNLYEQAVTYAKSAKRKAPFRADTWVCGLTVAKTPVVKKTAAKKKEQAAKTPAEKKACSEAGCPKDSYSKGLCAQHYTARRRQDPAERVKANEASRRWREKKAAAKADAQVSK